MKGWSNGGASVRDDLDLVGRQSPVRKALLDKLARCDEAVDLAEMGLNMLLTQEEAICCDIRKAAAAAVGCGVITSLASLRAHHQAVMSADRIIVMKRHDDARARQDAAHECDEFHTHEQNMVNMNDVGTEILKQADEMWDNAIAVDLAQIELIEMPAPHDDFIGSVPRGLKARSRALPAMEIVRRRKEQSLYIGTRPILTKEIMGEDFGSACMKIRVVVGNDKHACSQEAYSGFEAMMTSW